MSSASHASQPTPSRTFWTVKKRREKRWSDVTFFCTSTTQQLPLHDVDCLAAQMLSSGKKKLHEADYGLCPRQGSCMRVGRMRDDILAIAVRSGCCKFNLHMHIQSAGNRAECARRKFGPIPKTHRLPRLHNIVRAGSDAELVDCVRDEEQREHGQEEHSKQGGRPRLIWHLSAVL